MTNETTCLLPTSSTTATAAITTTTTASAAAGDDAYSDDYESSCYSTNRHICNTFQTENNNNNNKYAYGSLVVVARPWWSSESEDSIGTGDDEKEYCKAKQPMLTSKKKSLVVKTCLLLLLACIFWRFSSNSKVVSSEQQQQTNNDFTIKHQQLGKSAAQHGSSGLQQKNKNKINDINHKNSNNNIQNDDDLQSMDDFLQERQAHPTRHFVIGNKAGDADSVVSALTLAYIESYAYAAAMNVFQNENNDSSQKQKKTPIASITRADFQTQRPDIFLLFQWAGISSNHVLFVDDIPSLVVNVDKTTTAAAVGNNDRVVVAIDVTLTDHNVMDIDMPSSSSWSVVEIVDHHVDQGQHVDTCTGDSRMIAFEQKKALVASCCSLIAERLQQVWRAVNHGDDDDDNNNKGKRRRTRTAVTAPAVPPPLYYYYPASMSLLLLGVILIDSMNLSPHANAATLRDVNAVQDLLEHTNWRDLPLETQNQLGIINSNSSPTTTTAKPNTTLIFNKLQDAKYNPDFWKSLSVRDALRLDYKDYKYGDDALDITDAAVDGHGQKASGGGVFGISSIRIPIKDFLANKQDLVADIINYMVDDAHIDFLAIMPVFVDENGQYLKQLVLINRNNEENNAPPPFFDKLKLYLLQQEPLGLQQIQVNQKTVGLHQKLAAENNNDEDSTTSPPNNNGIVLLGDDNLPDQSISLVFFNQLNIQPTRKQIGPILRMFFDNNNNI